MPWSKEDRSFKILINRRVTSSSAAYYEEFGDNTLDISFSEVKTEPIAFNNPAQAITDGVGKVYSLFTLTADPNVGVPGTTSQQSFYAYDPADPTASSTDKRLRDWIGEKYGSDYRLKLYDNNDSEITPTACEWFFDYPTGILTINGNPPNYAKPFKVSGWRYIGEKGGTVNGNIGQKPIYDQQFFPTNQAGANNRVPVFVAANDRYELQDLPSFSATDIQLITKKFVATTNQTVFVVDSNIEKILYVSINGLVQEEGDDYTISYPRTVTFINPVQQGKQVVIKYFETLNAVVVSSGLEELNPVLFVFQVGDATHFHLVKLRYSEVKLLVEDAVTSVQITSNELNGHQHTLTVEYDTELATFNVTNITNATGTPHLAKLIGGGGGNFSKEILTGNINGSVIDLPPLIGPTRKAYVDVVSLNYLGDTIPPSITITDITNLTDGCIVRIYSPYTLSFPNRINLRTEGGISTTIVGANGDWIEFVRRAGTLYQNNIGTFDYIPTLPPPPPRGMEA